MNIEDYFRNLKKTRWQTNSSACRATRIQWVGELCVLCFSHLELKDGVTLTEDYLPLMLSNLKNKSYIKYKVRNYLKSKDAIAINSTTYREMCGHLMDSF